jgi:MYXO-CTERM domain-containing protein
VAWAEQQTGLDLTPCHDSHGWVGGPTCNGFSTDPDRTGGTWSTLCQGQTLLLAPTCGATYDAGAGADGGSPIDADPEALDATSDARFADAMRTDSVLDAEPADAPGGNAEVGQPAGPDDASGTGSAADGSVGLVDAGGIPDDVATSGTGGIAGASTSGGTTGGTVTGSGGWAASGGQAGRVSSAGGAPAAGGNTTTLDGSGGTGGSHNGTAPHTASNSGCSCRMESAGPLRAPVTLLVLGLLVGGRLRRRVKQTIAGLVMPAE